MNKLVQEQQTESEHLNKKEAGDRQAIILLETCVKNNEGIIPPYKRFLNVLLLFEYFSYFEIAFRLTELLAKHPSIDEISAKLEVLESENESLQQSLK
jgi:hypothetical protein